MSTLCTHTPWQRSFAVELPWQMLTAVLRLGSPGLACRSGSRTISRPLLTEGAFQKFSNVLGLDIIAYCSKNFPRHTRSPRFPKEDKTVDNRFVLLTHPLHTTAWPQFAKR